MPVPVATGVRNPHEKVHLSLHMQKVLFGYTSFHDPLEEKKNRFGIKCTANVENAEGYSDLAGASACVLA